MDRLWYLHGGLFFTGLDYEREVFFRSAKKKTYRKNEIVFLEDDPGDACFYLHSGLIRIFSSSDNGKTPIYFLRRPGEMFGLSEVLTNAPRRATAQTLTDAEVYSISSIDFDNLLSGHYTLARRVMTVLGRRIRYLGDRINGLVANDVMNRLIKLLISLVYEKITDQEAWQKPIEVPVRLSQEQMASLIGSTQPTVSDILRQLQKEQFIIVDQRKVIVCNPALLLARAEEL